jgi:Na+-translocating ferredoxin:NAD+ oxidoreductase RnfE subunit
VTFTERIAHRQRWGVWVWIVGFLMVASVCAALIFVVAVTAPPIYVLCIVVGIIALFAYFGGWVSARFFADNIDGIVQEMGPIRRRLLVGAILEEAKDGGNMEEFIHPLTKIEAKP